MTAHEDDFRGFHGDVGAGRQGDAHIGGGQGGGVVDAVAHHGHNVSFPAQAPDFGGFVAGEHFGEDVIVIAVGDARLGGDGVGGAAIVSGDHRRCDAPVFQSGHHVGGFGFDGVGCGDDAHEAILGVIAVHGHDGGFTFGGQGVVFVLHGEGDAELIEKRRAADAPGAAVDPGFDSPARKGPEGLDGGEGESPLFGGFHHGDGQGMLGVGFGRRRGRQQVILIEISIDDNVGEYGLSLGEGSGFVEDDPGDAVGGFQGAAAFEEEAEFGAPSGAHHNRRGGGQSQGTGAGDNQNGDEYVEGEDPRSTADEPYPAGEEGDGDDDGDEIAGNHVGEAGDGGFGALGFFHQANDSGEDGVPAHPGGLDVNHAVGVDGGSHHFVADALVHGDAFAGNHGFINGGGAEDDAAVRGDAFTGFYQEDVAGADFGDGDFDWDAGFGFPGGGDSFGGFGFSGTLGSFGYFRGSGGFGAGEDKGGSGLEGGEFADGFGGFPLGYGFEEFSQEDEGDNHPGGFEVEVGGHGRIALEDADEGPDAVEDGGGGADGDEGVHVGMPPDQGAESGCVESMPGGEDGNGEGKLGEGEAQGTAIGLQKSGDGQAEHVPHGQIDQGEGEEGGEEESGEQGSNFALSALPAFVRYAGRGVVRLMVRRVV